MPLYNKSPKKGKGNQGAQWGDTGSAGNIKQPVRTGEIAGGPSKPAHSSKRGRNQSIGRSRGRRKR